MKKSKMLSMLLVGVMILSSAGCGNTGEGTSTQTQSEPESAAPSVAEEEKVINDGWFPIVDETITIKTAGENANTVDWNETDMVAWFGEEMGIQMECTQYEGDVWSTQFSLILASEELPDLFVNPGDIAVINKNARDGYFLAISDYLDYAPNLKAFLEEHPDYKAMCTAPDGKIYGLVQYNDNKYARSQRAFINRVWLENVGMDYPETVDEFYEVLKAFKEKDANGNGDPNDEIPMSADGGTGALFLALMSAFGMNISDESYGLMLEDGQVTLAQTTDNWQAYLKFMNKLYEEGLYEEAALVQTYDEFVAKVSDGRVGTFSAPAPFVVLKADASADADYYAVGGMTSEWNDTGVFPLSAGVGTSVKLAVSADTAYPEAIVRLIDYFYTTEGILMSAKGTEKSYKLEENTFDSRYLNATTFIPEGEEGNYDSAEAYRYKKAIINEGFNMVKSMEGTEYAFVDGTTDDILAKDEVLLQYGWSVLMERRMREIGVTDVFPALVYEDEEADRRSTLKTDISSYISQATAQFISGEMDVEKDYEGYLNKLNQMGLEELLQIEQTAYDRMYQQ